MKDWKHWAKFVVIGLIFAAGVAYLARNTKAGQSFFGTVPNPAKPA